jgi:DNA repair protein RadC
VRLRLERAQGQGLTYQITSPADVYRLCSDLEDADREVILGVYLDARNHVNAVSEVSTGTLNSSIVHPREVYKPAVLTTAGSVVLVRNHPSGDASPSDDDHALTRRIKKAGDVLGVELIDHVIIGYNRRILKGSQ